MTPSDKIDIIVQEIDANPQGDYRIIKISIRYIFVGVTEDLLGILNQHQSVDLLYENIPENIRLAIESFVAFVRSKIEIPVKYLGGTSFRPTVEMSHAAYKIDSPDTPDQIRSCGWLVWGNGQRQNYDVRILREQTPDQNIQLCEQIRPWSRNLARQHAQSIIDKLFHETKGPVVFPKKTEILISYKKGEADAFADMLFHSLGESNLFTPRMDVYDINSGLWLKQIENYLENCRGMIALITPGYQSGNISQLEKENAIIKARESEGFKLVPIIFQSEPTGFLKLFQWVDFREYFRTTQKTDYEKSFGLLREFLLGVNRNPYG